MSQIVKVADPEQVKTTALLAEKIWNAHYVPIIGQEQVDFMLEKFQSEKAISEQLASGYEYYLLFDQNSAVGYLGLIPNEPPGKMMISKIYLDASVRSKGFGGQLLDFAKRLCTKKDLRSLWLTVNRHNRKTIAWYQKKGFSVVNEVKQDIGEGYFMDDYVMELVLIPH